MRNIGSNLGALLLLLLDIGLGELDESLVRFFPSQAYSPHCYGYLE
jgi:hypothetical protein